MANIHEKIVNQIIFDWSKSDRGRLFKNHQGQAWIGKPSSTNKHGAILIEFAKKITFGLKKGSSDLIGWEYMSIVDYNRNIIKLPIFCSIEVKTKSSPDLKPEQVDWLSNIIDIGGCGYLAMETDDGYDLREWRND